MANICVIGDYDSICGFNALGIDTFDVATQEKAEAVLKNVIDNGYVIVFITEDLAVKVSDVLDEYRIKPTPAIIPIPSVAGTNGFGVSYVRKALEQAVGSADMIFSDEE